MSSSVLPGLRTTEFNVDTYRPPSVDTLHGKSEICSISWRKHNVVCPSIAIRTHSYGVCSYLAHVILITQSQREQTLGLVNMVKLRITVRAQHVKNTAHAKEIVDLRLLEALLEGGDSLACFDNYVPLPRKGINADSAHLPFMHEVYDK
ncbi:hypothetical protein KIN20_001772 [Parelaphostrongylus tenuis]|uniref:Uncharacterized protein n=1 Tax=Parelaphostrongylus tenuis TaxID=148309 RepID=A0AAD5QHA8_PARTN|nr:hypothetical protein KIN20_001772 [Parelaphostrongylus tenuis]